MAVSSSRKKSILIIITVIIIIINLGILDLIFFAISSVFD